MSVKLIALDMDGTTLNDNHITMTRDNRSAILEAISHNIMIVPATGRTFSDLPGCVKRLSGISYAITSNGASVIDLNRGEEIYKNWMSAEIAKEVLNILEARCVYTEVYYEKTAYAEHRSYAHLDTSVKSWPVWFYYTRRRKVKRLSDFIKETGKFIEKIEIMPNRYQKEEILSKLHDLPITISTSGMDSIEITNQGADKADGLAHLCEHLILNAKDVVAIGDSGNDLTMLKWAGVSCAVANADQDVLKAADFVTKRSSESGVASAIRYLALGDETAKNFMKLRDSEK